MPKLEDWEMFMMNLDPLMPPEMQIVYLTGRVYEHPRFEDGERIVTSMVVYFNIKEGRAETRSGSKYTLCKPSMKWVEWLKKNGYEEHLDDLLKLSSVFIN
jgi:hypothetical protein